MHMNVLQPPTQLREVILSSAYVSGDDLVAFICRVGHSPLCLVSIGPSYLRISRSMEGDT